MLLQTRLPDGGPLYAETNLDHLIAEPWNAASAALFLLIVAYWARKIWGKWRENPFLSFVVPVLAIGGIGGSLYHAFRVSQVFLTMDWMPIMILCLAASMYFFSLASGRWWLGLLVMVVLFFLQGLMYRLLPPSFGINAGYALMGLMVLTPTVWLLALRRFEGAKWVALALIAFVAALFFRIADGWGWLPMGTHFLWHVFGAAACHLMLEFIYRLKKA